MSDFERLTGRRLQMLDIGGGFPAQYATEPVPSINLFGESIRSALSALPYAVDLVVAVVLLRDRQDSPARPLGRSKTRGPIAPDQLALAVDVQFGRWDSSPHSSS